MPAWSPPTAPRRPRARWLTPSTRRPSGSRASPRSSIRASATAGRSGNALMPDAKEIDARIRGSFARQTIMTTLGAEISAVRPGEVEIVLPFSDRILQQHGFIHAGAVATIADSACGYAALTVMPGDAAVLTTEFKINLLSPAKGDRLRAVGRVIRSGKTLVVTLGEVFAETAGASKQIAMITATMMVVSTGSGLRD